MTDPRPQSARQGNLLIERMTQRDQRLLFSMGENCNLWPGEVLYERGQQTEFVLFPSCGAVALVVPAHATPGLAVYLVGREGMLGTHHVFSDRQTTTRAVVQTSGAALKVRATEFAVAMSVSPGVRRAMLAYVCGVLGQIALAGVHARFSAIGRRLARWLLIVRDRTASDRFQITQASLALMLGVRRGGVSDAARELQRLRLIVCRRGELEILDVVGLRVLAGDHAAH